MEGEESQPPGSIGIEQCSRLHSEKDEATDGNPFTVAVNAVMGCYLLEWCENISLFQVLRHNVKLQGAVNRAPIPRKGPGSNNNKHCNIQNNESL